MNRSTNTITTVCPSCDVRIYFSRRPNLGDVVVCQECEETLQVISLTPLKVDWSVFDDDESWVDADFDDYEDYGNNRNDRFDWD